LYKRVIEFESGDSAYGNEPVDFRGDEVKPTLSTQVVACEARDEKIDEVMPSLAAENAEKGTQYLDP
jgi:hypothetical protein